MRYRKTLAIMLAQHDMTLRAGEAEPDYAVLERMRLALPFYHRELAHPLVILACRPDRYALEIEEVCALVPPSLRDCPGAVQVTVETMLDVMHRATVFVLHLQVDKERIPKSEPAPAVEREASSTLDSQPRRRLTIRGKT